METPYRSAQTKRRIDREDEVLRRRGENETLAAIGEDLGISRTRVHQIEHHAMIRHGLKKAPQGYRTTWG